MPFYNNTSVIITVAESKEGDMEGEKQRDVKRCTQHKIKKKKHKLNKKRQDESTNQKQEKQRKR